MDIPGAGRGHLPGYDPVKSGVLNVQELFGILTRYMVDEYPHRKRYRATHFGCRPIQVAKQVNHEYGAVIVPADHDRRIHLGWRAEAKVTDSGVTVFGVPFNSSDLQILRDKIVGKAMVYVDPDDISQATIVLQDHPHPVLVDLTWTGMKHLTLPEFLEIARARRAEAPEETELCEEQLVRVRRERGLQMAFIATEHNLPRSYMTRKEAETKSRYITAGVHGRKRQKIPDTASPGAASNPARAEGIRTVGAGHAGAVDHEPTQDTDNAPDVREQRFSKPDTGGKLR